MPDLKPVFEGLVQTVSGIVQEQWELEPNQIYFGRPRNEPVAAPFAVILLAGPNEFGSVRGDWSAAHAIAQTVRVDLLGVFRLPDDPDTNVLFNLTELSDKVAAEIEAIQFWPGGGVNCLITNKDFDEAGSEGSCGLAISFQIEYHGVLGS